jgi:hypothetical protein
LPTVHELAALLAPVNHQPTFDCVVAERAFLEALGGTCHSPVAAQAEHGTRDASSLKGGNTARGRQRTPGRAQTTFASPPIWWPHRPASPASCSMPPRPNLRALVRGNENPHHPPATGQ